MLDFIRLKVYTYQIWLKIVLFLGKHVVQKILLNNKISKLSKYKHKRLEYNESRGFIIEQQLFLKRKILLAKKNTSLN